jgi:hypothetical protein
MLAALFASVIVTVCVASALPPFGEITGVAASGRLIVYVALATALGLMPGATAITLSVSDFVTVVGSAHCGEEVVGVVPSVVQ